MHPIVGPWLHTLGILGCLFRYVISVSIHVYFAPIAHESASHSMGYEYTPSILGIGSTGTPCARPLCDASHPMACRSPAGGRREPLAGWPHRSFLPLHLR